MKILVVILARGGSKRLRNKNIIKLGKQSLLSRTISFAKKYFACKNIIVSTDSKRIADIAKKNQIKIPWLRPKKYSLDKSSSESAVFHALNWYEKKVNKVDALVLLQPTTPFRSIRRFKKTMEIFKKNTKKNYVSISKPKDLSSLNGSFYIISTREFKKEKAFLTKNSIGIFLKDKKEQIDIDTKIDLNRAKSFL